MCCGTVYFFLIDIRNLHVQFISEVLTAAQVGEEGEAVV
jgi:hypothetical protein